MHSVDTETRHGPGSYLRTLENRIRERAHEIWTAHGCIDGQADQHWLAAEHEILMESTASLPGVQQKRRFRARSKNSVWRCELRIKFFGMLFGVGIAAVGAAAFSLGAHHDGSAPASPGPIRETAAPASAPQVGAEMTASKRVEATSVDTDRASTESDVASDGKSNLATTCEADGAACGVFWAVETRQMGQVLEEHGPMFRKLRCPRLRSGQPWNTPNPSRHSAGRLQQTGQIQSLAAPMAATVHPALTAFGLGPGKLVL